VYRRAPAVRKRANEARELWRQSLQENLMCAERQKSME
jgi:hypothetical protein